MAEGTFNFVFNRNDFSDPIEIPAGTYLWAVEGSLDEGAAALQVCPLGVWVDLRDGSMFYRTTRLPLAISPVHLPAGKVRVALSGEGSPCINSVLERVG